MPIPRPTASTITDDQLDALWTALDEVDALHFEHFRDGKPMGWCNCGHSCPCPTVKIISRQRSRALESACPKDGRARGN